MQFCFAAIVCILFAAMSFAADPPASQPFHMEDIVAPGAKVEQRASGLKFTEGPVWFRNNLGGYSLVFSDIPANELKSLDPQTNRVTTFQSPSNNSNGNTTDREGRLVTA